MRTYKHGTIAIGANGPRAGEAVFRALQQVDQTINEPLAVLTDGVITSLSGQNAFTILGKKKKE